MKLISRQFRVLLLLATVAASVALRAPLASPAEAALQLATAVSERASGSDLTTVGRMELVDKGRAARTRELVSYRIDRGRGDSLVLVRFVGPPDIAGTGLLSSNKANGGTDQWLYLPELDRVRRVASDRKGGRFVGSELYFEDLQERSPALDRHRIVGQETLDGVACEILESVPIDPSTSVYRKRVSWIDPQTSLALRVDYYEKSDAEPAKRWLLAERKKIQGYWTVTDSRMIDLASGRETRLVVEVAKYDRNLPPRLFTPQALADEKLESEFRP